MAAPRDDQLENLHSGTEYTRSFGSPIPAHYGDPANEYEALKGGAALLDRSDRVVLRLTGKDPVGMLNAILTNEVPQEEPHLGVYATLLNPKGRIQTDLRVLKSGEGVLIDTEAQGAAAAKEILGRYAPFSRIRIEDLSEADVPWSILGLYGPRATYLLGDLQLREHETTTLEIGDDTLLAAGVTTPVPGVDCICPANALPRLREHLLDLGATPTGLDAYETVRVETGIPRFGRDITSENFPGESGILERAVSFSKGCYPGQETVARMHYRGHPNRTLHRFALEGPPPTPDTPLIQNEKPVGNITSTAPLPVNGQTFALGYLSRKADLDAPLHAGDATVHLAP